MRGSHSQRSGPVGHAPCLRRSRRGWGWAGSHAFGQDCGRYHQLFVRSSTTMGAGSLAQPKGPRPRYVSKGHSRATSLPQPMCGTRDCILHPCPRIVLAEPAHKGNWHKSLNHKALCRIHESALRILLEVITSNTPRVGVPVFVRERHVHIRIREKI